MPQLELTKTSLSVRLNQRSSSVKVVIVPSLIPWNETAVVFLLRSINTLFQKIVEVSPAQLPPFSLWWVRWDLDPAPSGDITRRPNYRLAILVMIYKPSLNFVAFNFCVFKSETFHQIRLGWWHSIGG